MKDIKVINEYGKKISFTAAVMLMDDEIREQLHYIAETMTPQEFYDLYCKIHRMKYHETFTI